MYVASLPRSSGGLRVAIKYAVSICTSGVLLCLLFLAIQVSADDQSPIVMGPEDRAGADVVWFVNQQYELNATGSSDDTGIVSYTWQIYEPDGSWWKNITSTTPTAKWTPTHAGLYKVISWARDASGNVGWHVYVIDVARVMSPGTTGKVNVSYNSSVAIRSGAVKYKDTNIGFTGGLPADASDVMASDMLGESLAPSAGALSGHWEPYYYLTYWINGNAYYGKPSEDRTTVFKGDRSISIANSDLYYYGFEYHFDSPADLSNFNVFTFWFKSANSNYPYSVQMTFYMGTGYQSPYTYTYITGVGSYASYKGWYGVSVPLDRDNINYWYTSGTVTDLSSVSSIRIYMYNYRYGPQWIDNVGFSQVDAFGDDITESKDPTGPMSGSWTSSGSAPTTSSMSIQGNNSVGFPLSGSTRRTFTYSFDSPQNMTGYDSLRFLTWYSSYRYVYWSGYQFYVYSQNGGSCYYYMDSSYMHYRAAYYSGNWDMRSLPWGPSSGPYVDSSVDWTQVTRIAFANVYTYSSSSGTLLIDGLEWIRTGDDRPVNREDIPHGMYLLPAGSLEMDGVNFTSNSTQRAFLRADGNITIMDSTFDNLWGATHRSVPTADRAIGGIMVYGAAMVKLDNVTIKGSGGPGFFIQNSNLDAKRLTVKSAAEWTTASQIVLAMVGTSKADTHTMTLVDSVFSGGKRSSGLLVHTHETSGTATVTIRGVTSSDHGVNGIKLGLSGNQGSTTIIVVQGEEQAMKGFAERIVPRIRELDTLVAGDLLCWSAVVEPFRMTTNGVVRRATRLLVIESRTLRELCESDVALGYSVMLEVAKVMSHRLHGARVQVATH